MNEHELANIVRHFWYQGKAIQRRTDDPCSGAVAYAWKVAALELAEKGNILEGLARIPQHGFHDLHLASQRALIRKGCMSEVIRRGEL